MPAAAWPVALLCAMSVVASCAAAPATQGPPRPGGTAAPDPLAAMPPELGEAAREVEAARGLRFRAPVDVIWVDEDELEAHFDEGKLEPAPDATASDALWAFGLVKKRPPPAWIVSLLSLHVRRTSGLRGFYVKATRRAYVLRKHSFDADLAVHELAHALVDDHHGLALEAQTDDRQLALRSLVEGDATLTAALVVGRRRGKTDAAILAHASSWDGSRRDFASDADVALGRSVPMFRERSEVPYRAGSTFVARVVQARGLPGLDQVWSDPPRGTFEVFHPDLYAKGLALPSIARPELPAPCVAGTTGVMGELRARAFLQQAHPRATALSGAASLIADRYDLIEQCGQEPAFVWQTAFADDGAATRFEALAEEVFRCREAGCLPSPHRTVRRGRSVVVMRGVDDAGVAESALAAIAYDPSSAKPRLGGASLEPIADEPALVEGSSGKACEIAGSGVHVTVPSSLALVRGHELKCHMTSDTLDVSANSVVANAAYDKGFVEGVRRSLPATLSGLHAHVSIRERWRVTPLGSGLGFVADLTPPLRLEVVVVPICGGKRVLTLYMRSTNEEGRAVLEDALLSLSPTSVGLASACGDPVDLE